MKPEPAMVDAALRERYRVVETLIEGGDDTLSLCRRLDTLVELRVISGQLGADRFLISAFRQQATVVTRISSQCPGIAKVYECERAANGGLALVMEPPRRADAPGGVPARGNAEPALPNNSALAKNPGRVLGKWRVGRPRST